MTRPSHLLLLLLSAFFPVALMAAAPPSAPVGLCVQAQEGVTQCAVDAPAVSSGQKGVFPGTNLKFYPGFFIWTAENESLSSIENKWQALFTANPNRKVSYRPSGVYGGVIRRLAWHRFYTNQNVRPANPLNHADPGYNWSLLDAIFNINAVQNEGALVAIQVVDTGFGSRAAPNWIANAPYNGLFNAGVEGPATTKETLKYYRYAGPDNRTPSQLSNVTAASGPPITEEIVYFYQAMYDHLVATGKISKIADVTVSEVFVNNPSLPTDYNLTNLQHGVGVKIRKIAKIWAQSGIALQMTSMVGPSAPVWWLYMDNPPVAMTFPDMGMNGTNNFTSSGRFTRTGGEYQKDARPLSQQTETSGLRDNTFFAANVPNPWNYSNVSVPQTASHVLWALSGPPKGVNKNSGLGRPGDDPPGPMPVHTVIMQWGATWDSRSPSVSDWHKAIDTFGPPGTFAFPYLPPGYVP